MTRRGRPSDDLLRCARATGAAWSEIRKAEAALSRHADRQAPELRPAVTQLRIATTALRRAYRRLAPGRKTFRRTTTGRPELWRCRYCPALVFSRDRRVHLQYDERINTDGIGDPELEAHFTLAPQPEEPDTDDEEEEDELAGW